MSTGPARHVELSPHMELAPHTELALHMEPPQHMELTQHAEPGAPGAPRSPQGLQGHGGARPPWPPAPGSPATCQTGPWVPCVAAGWGSQCSQCSVRWDTAAFSCFQCEAGHRSVAVLLVQHGDRCHFSRHWCSPRCAWLDVAPCSRWFWCSRCSRCGVRLVLPVLLVACGWTPQCSLPVLPTSLYPVLMLLPVPPLIPVPAVRGWTELHVLGPSAPSFPRPLHVPRAAEGTAQARLQGEFAPSPSRLEGAGVWVNRRDLGKSPGLKLMTAIWVNHCD